MDEKAFLLGFSADPNSSDALVELSEVDLSDKIRIRDVAIHRKEGSLVFSVFCFFLRRRLGVVFVMFWPVTRLEYGR